MNDQYYFFFIKNFMEQELQTTSTNDSDIIAYKFDNYLKNNLNDSNFEKLLICTGFIPDTYVADSSEETLFSKLVEVIVSNWCERIGCISQFVKEKASNEDVNFLINNKVVVCDAKSFRLGRSQKAPNVKDFLKLEDVKKWLSRYKNRLGGLVTYPDTHEWTTRSDAYQYCTSKDTPTLMLPYKYLALLLHYKSNFTLQEFSQLWDYKTMFPNSLNKTNGNNKQLYWNIINSKLKLLLKISEKDFEAYINEADLLIHKCIISHLHILESLKEDKINDIIIDVKSKDFTQLQDSFISYRIECETIYLSKLIERIQKFRL